MVSNQETPQSRETPKQPTKRQQSLSRFSHLQVSRDTTLAGAKLLTIFKISRGEKTNKKTTNKLASTLTTTATKPTYISNHQSRCCAMTKQAANRMARVQPGPPTNGFAALQRCLPHIHRYPLPLRSVRQTPSISVR